MPQITKKGARTVTAALDRMANLFQTDWATLGVPQHIACDMAYRCDLLSDQIEKNAGLKTALSEFDPVQEKGFDPESIGEEQSGPIETVDSDEPFMKGEFTQQENRELRENVESGALGPQPILDPQAPQSGKQAFEKMGRQLVARNLGSSISALQSCTSPRIALNLRKLAHALLDVQAGVLSGQISAGRAEKASKAAGLVLPHLNGKDTAKVAQMLTVATKIAEEEEVPEVEEEKEDKKEAKKASHGFNLTA
jgi:hypothetical protein